MTSPRPSIRPDRSKAWDGGKSADQLLLDFLIKHLPSIALDEAGPECKADIRRLRRKVERAIDNGTPDVYYGPCRADDTRAWINDGTVYTQVVECGAELFGREEDAVVSCQTCGTDYDAAERRRWMRDQYRDELARPWFIAAALGISPALLDNWIARDKARLARPKRRNEPLWKHPPIIAASWTELDEHGQCLMVQSVVKGAPQWETTWTPLLDENGKPVLDEWDEPALVGVTSMVMVPAGKPLYRVGDVVDRVVALAGTEQEKLVG